MHDLRVRWHIGVRLVGDKRPPRWAAHMNYNSTRFHWHHCCIWVHTSTNLTKRFYTFAWWDDPFRCFHDMLWFRLNKHNYRAYVTLHAPRGIIKKVNGGQKVERVRVPPPPLFSVDVNEWARCHRPRQADHCHVLGQTHLIVVGGFLLHLFYPPDKWLFMRGKFSQEMTPSAPTKGGERVADLGGT